MQISIHYRLCLVVLLITISISHSYCLPNDTVYLNKTISQYILPKIQFIEDASHKKPLDTIIKLFEQGAYQKSSSNVTFNAGITFSTFWFKINIANNSNDQKEIFLCIHENIDTIQIFSKREKFIDTLYNTGFGYQYNDRPIKNRNFIFPLKLKENCHLQFYLKIRNNSDYLYMPIIVKDSKSLVEYESNRYQLLALYTGAFLFAIAFNIIIFISTRDKLHFWYALYILVALIYLMMEDGITYEFIQLHIPKLKFTLNTDYWWNIHLSLWLYIMQLILKQTKENSKHFILTKCNIFLLCFTTILQFILLSVKVSADSIARVSVYIISELTTFFSFILLLGGVIEKIIQKNKMAIYYLIAIGFGLVGTCNIYLNYLGITNSNLIEPNTMTVGLTIEIILLTILILYSYSQNLFQKEKLSKEFKEYKLEQSEKIINIQEEERKRLGEDLHDDIGSTASSLNLFVSNHFNKSNKEDQNSEEFQKHLLTQLNILALQIREVSHNLMPQRFSERSLIEIVDERVYSLNENTSIHFEFIHNEPTKIVNKSIEIAIYRILQELISNIIKHAEATKTTIQLNFDTNIIQVIVEDNGNGFDNTNIKSGFGLKNVRNRVSYLNGELNIDSNKLGTTFIIEIPI